MKITDIKALAKVGYDLALELRFKANDYHIKSDSHVILLYEAATLEDEVKDLIGTANLFSGDSLTLP